MPLSGSPIGRENSRPEPACKGESHHALPDQSIDSIILGCGIADVTLWHDWLAASGSNALPTFYSACDTVRPVNCWCIFDHGLAMDASSTAAASMFSVWACNVGACSVGIRTRVCGSGTWCCGSSSLFVEADACVANFAAIISKCRILEKSRYLLDAMLMAPSTLCQFPITVAMATPVSHSCSLPTLEGSSYPQFHQRA